MKKEIGQEYISVVTKVTANGSFETSYGLLYKFEYQMEDGTLISANHKTVENKLKEGDEAAYIIKGVNDYGNRGSVSKPFDRQRGNGGINTPPPKTTTSYNTNKDKSIVWQSLAKVSASLLSNQSKVNPEEATKITDYLVSYHDWKVGGENGEKPIYNKSHALEDIPF